MKAMRSVLTTALFLCAMALLLGILPGCTTGVNFIPPDKRVPIGREQIEVPSGFEITQVITGLSAPTAIAFDGDQLLVVAESGTGGDEPHIFAFRLTDGKRFEIYPTERRFPFSPVHPGFHIYGPVGGIACDHGKIYVSHRDSQDNGVITRFGYDGSHETLIADLPAQGDYGVTNLALGSDGRIYFGVGAATNSGVVGLDNLDWVKHHRQFCDKPFFPVILRGFRFSTVNPFANFFESKTSDTAPFSPFGISQTQDIPKAMDGKPTSAVCSIDAHGGDFRVEAWGYRYPRGLAFNEFGTLYFTNDGMENRGTRPVLNDPDMLYRLAPGAIGPFPDFANNGESISDPQFQPLQSAIVSTGYRSVLPVIDRVASHLPPPDKSLNAAEFPSQSGAAGLDPVPASGPFSRWRGQFVVALFGDRAPFSTGGLKLKGPQGYKVDLVDVYEHRRQDFIRNPRLLPLSRLGGQSLGLERPVDVKFGPDGSLYILDFGHMEMKGARPKIYDGTGCIFRVAASKPAASLPMPTTSTTLPPQK